MLNLDACLAPPLPVVLYIASFLICMIRALEALGSMTLGFNTSGPHQNPTSGWWDLWFLLGLPWRAAQWITAQLWGRLWMWASPLGAVQWWWWPWCALCWCTGSDSGPEHKDQGCLVLSLVPWKWRGMRMMEEETLYAQFKGWPI